MAEAKRIKRSLYKTSKIQIEFFMYEPRVEINKNTFISQVNPILNITYLNSKSMFEDYSTLQARTFKINPRNLYNVIKFFNTVVGWFYDESKRDLFLINEDDELVFNADYKNLYAITKKSFGSNEQLKAIPTVVDYNNQRHEGIYLYINESIYDILLTLDELEIIFGILKSFSFYDEIMLNLQILKYAQENNRMEEGSVSYNSATGFKIKTPFG